MMETSAAMFGTPRASLEIFVTFRKMKLENDHHSKFFNLSNSEEEA